MKPFGRRVSKIGWIFFRGNAFQLWYDEWFTRTYQATESHCISYFGGMLVGIIYHKMQNDDLYLAKSKVIWGNIESQFGIHFSLH